MRRKTRKCSDCGQVKKLSCFAFNFCRGDLKCIECRQRYKIVNPKYIEERYVPSINYKALYIDSLLKNGATKNV